MVHTITIPSVIKQSMGRDHAIRKIVANSPRLLDEFHKVYPTALYQGITAYSMMFDEFITLKGFEIISESPEIRVDEEGRYNVDVTYEIEEKID